MKTPLTLLIVSFVTMQLAACVGSESSSPTAGSDASSEGSSGSSGSTATSSGSSSSGGAVQNSKKPVNGGTSSGAAASSSGSSSGASSGSSSGADAGVDASDGAVDDGAHAEAEAGPSCLTDLSGIGTGDFHVTFTLVTTAQSWMALVNQRSACLPYDGWDVYMTPTGAIEVETDDGIAADRVWQVGGGPVNNGQPHLIEAARVGGYLWVETDGPPMSVLMPDTHALGSLPPIVVGTDPGGIGPDGCGSGVVEPLAGSLTDLCITR